MELRTYIGSGHDGGFGMNTVRAAVLREIGSVTIEEVQLDDPGAKEVLIKTAAVGVCHSDLHYIEGLYTTELPVIPGHESAGVVEAVGSEVTYVQPGDHVITCMSVSCGHCKLCSGGRPYLCEAPEAERGVGEPSRISQNGKRMNQLYHLSSYSEKLLVHEKAVVKIRKDMPLDVAALIGCAVITGFGAVTNAADVEIGSTVAVIGCGGIGLSAILGAVAAGASMIVAVDITDEKLETAKAFGATHTVNGARVDPVEAVRQLSGRGVDYAFEALGRVETAEQAFQMLAVGGDAVIIGMVPFGETVAVHGYDLLSEKTLRGSNMGNNRFRVDMPVLVERYVNGQLPLDDMISKRVSLDQINEAFADMKAGTVARSVIVFD
jgi:S-(hydroxymethyl)glutathione dehydrogenase/alcohol dehydrogenase